MSPLRIFWSLPRRRTRTQLVVALCALLLGALLAPLDAQADNLAAPGGLLPNSDDATVASAPALSDVDLSWSPVAGAVSYEIQVSDSLAFDPAVLSGATTALSWPLPATTPSGDYVWRVRAVSPAGPGAWSGAASFTHSWEVAPGGLRVRDAVGLPTVSWDPIPGASFYEVEYSLTPVAVDDPAAMQAGTDADRFTCYTQHAYLAPYGTATGTEKLPGDEAGCVFAPITSDPRVMAITAAWTACTETRTAARLVEDKAARTAAPPRAPDYTVIDTQDRDCRTKGVTDQLTVDPMSFKQFFPAREIPDPAVYGLVDPDTYRSLPWYVRVRGRNGTASTATSPFAAPAIACTGVWSSAGGTLAPGSHVVTVPIPSAVPKYLAVPECSAWSAPASFQVLGNGGAVQSLAGTPVAGASAQPAGPAVLGGSPVLRGTPVFTWRSVTGAAKYRVYLSRTRDLRSADHVWETAGTSLAPYGTLPDARRLYWGVQACGWETCGPIGTVLTFAKAATSPVVAQSVTSTAVDATFVWHTQTDGVRLQDLVAATDSEARSYQLQADPVGTTWAKPAIDVTVDASRRVGESTDISRTAVSLVGLPDATYTWRVRAVDESGSSYPWSVGTAFLRDVAVPTAHIELKPAFAQSAPFAVTFSEPVTVPTDGLSVRTAAGVAVAGTLSGSGPTWQFVPATPWITGATYTFSVTAGTDGGGHPVTPVAVTLRAAVVADSSTPALVAGRAGAWQARSATDALGTSYLRSSVPGATLTTTLTGAVVRVYACRGPRSGQLGVTVDGRVLGTVDLYRSYSGCGSVFAALVKRGLHTVTLAVGPGRNVRSTGGLVGVDAVATL